MQLTEASHKLLPQFVRRFPAQLIAGVRRHVQPECESPVATNTGCPYSLSIRASIRREIDEIEPLDAKESRAKVTALQWIDSGIELCRLEKPATPPQHLVSYFVLVDVDYLLPVDHINAGLWLPSGGHVEPGEHPRDTVTREVVEELGVSAQFMRRGPLFLSMTETVGKTAGHTDVSLWYVLTGSREKLIDFDRSEFRGIKWFHRDELPLNRSDPEMGRFVSKLYGQHRN
jgi:8-oxo-dGTP diphosphatase